MTIEILLTILNLIILESLLSIDNAAVLAIMVKDLPSRQTKKALRYGILGAYIFRGVCLFTAAWLIKIVWLKMIGGLYLMYLVYDHFTKSNNTIEETSKTKDSKVYKFAHKLGFNRFWATVLLVEIMDLMFSIDNIFASVALSSVFWIIIVGVCIGILAVRLIAEWFVIMIGKYPSLENSAFIVIFLLGLKLIVLGMVDYIDTLIAFKIFFNSRTFEIAFSIGMLFIFFIPILISKDGKDGKDGKGTFVSQHRS